MTSTEDPSTPTPLSPSDSTTVAEAENEEDLQQTSSSEEEDTEEEEGEEEDGLLPLSAEEALIHERIGSIKLYDPDRPKRRWSQTPFYLMPYARAKLEFLRDYKGGPTEVTAFGVALDPNDPLLVHDIIVPKQECTSVSVDIDTEDLEQRVEAYRQRHREVENEVLHPYQVNSVWIHTHPGNSASPSWTDDKTFEEKKPSLFFVMYILAQGGQQHCEMKLSSTETVLDIPCEDVKPKDEYEPTEEDVKEWSAIYEERIKNVSTFSTSIGGSKGKSRGSESNLDPRAYGSDSHWAAQYREYGGYGGYGSPGYGWDGEGGYSSSTPYGTGWDMDSEDGGFDKGFPPASIPALIARIKGGLSDMQSCKLPEAKYYLMEEVSTLMGYLEELVILENFEE